MIAQGHEAGSVLVAHQGTVVRANSMDVLLGHQRKANKTQRHHRKERGKK